MPAYSVLQRYRIEIQRQANTTPPGRRRAVYNGWTSIESGGRHSNQADTEFHRVHTEFHREGKWRVAQDAPRIIALLLVGREIGEWMTRQWWTGPRLVRCAAVLSAVCRATSERSWTWLVVRRGRLARRITAWRRLAVSLCVGRISVTTKSRAVWVTVAVRVPIAVRISVRIVAPSQ